MAFYSQLFWITMFMQHMQNLTPFEVAVRLLPQALVGLVVSPLVGLIMHKVPGTILLAIGGFALFLSNMLLVFIHHGSSYFVWIFPSLILSTVGMDWIINVGSLHVLSELPLCHHSVGASLLQTTARLSVPIGMAVTTAIWSSYEDKGGFDCPELPYTFTFVTTAVLSGLALLMVPFIRIGKQGSAPHECFDSCGASEVKSKTASAPPCGAGRDSGNRPSKRWSLVDTVSQTSSSFVDHNHNHSAGCNKSRRAASSTASHWSKGSIDPCRSVASGSGSGSGSASSTRTTVRTPMNHGGRSGGIVWVVCEDCGTKKKQQQRCNGGEGPSTAHPAAHSTPTTTTTTATTHGVVGDPARYFNDPACGGTSASESGRSPKGGDPAVRPYLGRRRLPLVNREAMTYQMITQGFQP